MKLAAASIAFAFAFAMACAVPAGAEPPSPTARAEVAKLAPLVGRWKGVSWMDLPGGRHHAVSEETVEMRLDGRALLIEGLHRDRETGAVTHHALGVLAWDDRRREFRMASALASGLTGSYGAKLEGKHLVWMLAGPQGPKRRFTIALDVPGRWLERGEISDDGVTWKTYFEMRLERVE